MIYLLSLIFGYLLGSIPFGLVLCRIFGYGDIRKIGSGNIGATNVLRTGNKPLALATLLLDSGKGAMAVVFVLWLFDDFNGTILAGLGAILGHLFPIWLNFKGGKGVATTLGTMIALAPVLGLLLCGVWLMSALLFRISSLAALIALAAAPIFSFLMFDSLWLTLFCGSIAGLIWFKHRENIKRLLAGEEPKIGAKT